MRIWEMTQCRYEWVDGRLENRRGKWRDRELKKVGSKEGYGMGYSRGHREEEREKWRKVGEKKRVKERERERAQNFLNVNETAIYGRVAC